MRKIVEFIVNNQYSHIDSTKPIEEVIQLILSKHKNAKIIGVGAFRTQ